MELVTTCRTVLAAALALAPTAAAQNPNTQITSTAQELSVEIVCPNVADEGTAPTFVSAKARLGPPQSTPVNVVLVLDLSTSMAEGGNDIVAPAGVGPEDDLNGDGAAGQIVDALIAGLVPFTQSLGANTPVDVSIVWFSNQAFVVDMGPAAGVQTLLTPPDLDASGNGRPDLEDIVRSLDVTSVGLFTAQSSVFGTNYNAALEAMNALFAAQPPGEIDVAFFMSDGRPNMGGPLLGATQPLADTVAAGTIVNSFGFGVDAFDLCQPGEPLDVIASQTGGTCTAVANPANLATKLPAAVTTEIVRLDLYVNQNLVTSVFGPEESELCLDPIEIGAFLKPGVNVVEACAVAADQTSVCAQKDLQDTLCKLMVGFTPANLVLPSGDVLLLGDLWCFEEVTMSQIPSFTIPNVPSLAGLRARFQVGMYNEVVFPNDPLQLSNGVELVIGSGWSKYGPTTTMDLWLQGSGLLGSTVTPRFSIANLP
jgi:hypothetical protein